MKKRLMQNILNYFFCKKIHHNANGNEPHLTFMVRGKVFE